MTKDEFYALPRNGGLDYVPSMFGRMPVMRSSAPMKVEGYYHTDNGPVAYGYVGDLMYRSGS